MIEHDDRRCSTALAEVSTSKGDRDLPPRFRRFFKGFGAFDTRPTARICQTLPGAFCQSTPLAGELRGNCLARNASLVEVCGSSLGDALDIAGRGPDHDRDLTQPTRTCFAPIDDEAKRPLRHVALVFRRFNWYAVHLHSTTLSARERRRRGLRASSCNNSDVVQMISPLVSIMMGLIK